MQENGTFQSGKYIKISQLPDSFYAYVDSCINIIANNSSIGKTDNMEEWHILDVDHCVGFGFYEKGLLNNIRCFRFNIREEECASDEKQMGAWLTGVGDMPSAQTLRKLINRPLQSLKQKISLDKIRSIVCAESVSTMDSEAIKSLNENEDAILYLDYKTTKGLELGEFIWRIRNIMKSNIAIYILFVW